MQEQKHFYPKVGQQSLRRAPTRAQHKLQPKQQNSSATHWFSSSSNTRSSSMSTPLASLPGSNSSSKSLCRPGRQLRQPLRRHLLDLRGQRHVSRRGFRLARPRAADRLALSGTMSPKRLAEAHSIRMRFLTLPMLRLLASLLNKRSLLPSWLLSQISCKAFFPNRAAGR